MQSSQWAKSPKKQSVGVFLDSKNERINKKHSFRLFFGDFAHWNSFILNNRR